MKELSEKVILLYNYYNQLLSLKSDSSSDLQNFKNHLEATLIILNHWNSLSVMNNELSELKTQYDAIKSQLNVISIDTLN